MNKHVNIVLRNILNSWAQGLLTQEETINKIKETADYEQVSISRGSSHQDRPDVQTVQSTEDDAA